jgi:hypothetical protein
MDHDISQLPPAIISYLHATNITTISLGDDLDLFFNCWKQPHCPACLSSSNKYPCSWCAVSQTCVPNTVYGYPFGILSPIQVSDICPLAWRERWELRARPFSCRCSSMTFVSVVVAILATLMGVLLMWLALQWGRWCSRRWTAREPGWWRVNVPIPRWQHWFASTGTKKPEHARRVEVDDERAPLIP